MEDWIPFFAESLRPFLQFEDLKDSLSLKIFFFFNFDCLWPVQVFELVFQVCWTDAAAPCSTAPQSCSLPATYAVLETIILKLSAKLVQLVHVHINPPTHSFHSKMSKIMGSFQKNLKNNGLRFLLWQIHNVND